MADLRGFDANTVEPQTGFDPLPAGRYVAVITESEDRPNKSGVGSHLALTFEVIEGEFKGRKLWARLNLHHPNATVVAIARAELSAICRAVLVMAPKDSCELHGLPLTIQVKRKKRSDNGEVVNEISGYFKKESNPAPTFQSSAHSPPPWKR